ncbi:MAG TPA: hypothetical protein VFF06_14145, partial [Polyangia bacterium]|nr:hypothetical protein [Polyangia bacterium]
MKSAPSMHLRFIRLRVSCLRALVVALPLLSAAACNENVLDPMADSQPRVHQYSESVFFADGLSMRAP